MALLSRNKAGILSGLAQVLILVCILALIGWYVLEKNTIRELLISNDRTEEVTVNHYREFAAAVKNPHVKIILFAADISRDYSDERSLSVNRSLEIHGNDFIYDAQFRGRHLEILAEGKLSVISLDFTNGALSDDTLAQGGAIFIEEGAEASFDRCSFINNSVSSISPKGVAQGGAVFGNGLFTDCTFTQNQTIGGLAQGGAVYQGEYRKCSFADNRAQSATPETLSQGGAAWNGNFIDCLFAGNKSTAIGDAFGGAAGTGQFLNCLFRDNISESERNNACGGAVSEVTALNCTFFNNQATGSYDAEIQGGSSWKGNYINCTFTQNRAYTSNKQDMKPIAISSGDTVQSLDIPVAPRVMGGACYAGSFTNCILTGNSSPQDTLIGRDAFYATSLGGNVVGDAVKSNFEAGLNDLTGAHPADVFGGNGLAKNGGMWETIAIVPGSPAEKRGIHTPMIPETDARGIHRSSLVSDSGAFELTAGIMDSRASSSPEGDDDALSTDTGEPMITKLKTLSEKDIYVWRRGKAIPVIQLGTPESAINASQKDTYPNKTMEEIMKMKKKFGNLISPKKSSLRWRVEDLPPGVSFDAESTEIRGKPTEEGKGRFQIKIIRENDDNTVGIAIVSYQVLP